MEYYYCKKSLVLYVLYQFMVQFNKCDAKDFPDIKNKQKPEHT